MAEKSSGGPHGAGSSPGSGPRHPRPNHLADASSPYLRQHAHNPVDWYPWGPEALERSRREDRPIFLSIGYAACHWCHVMERESFENDAIAAFLNDHFVSIKVDREERPDLDDIYMAAVQMISGQGGWPMSVFLTPDLRPFFGGTYFPPEDRHGRPGFARLLQGLLNAYRSRRSEIESGASQVMDALQARTVTPASSDEPSRSTWDRAVRELEASFDPRFGGFGSAPKFPHGFAVQILLREHDRSGAPRPLEMAVQSLDAMALGGLYDHLGGGFHRYSTDEEWLAPHFEKMLYDQGLLVLAYAEAVQVTGSELYARVVRESCDYVLRDLTDPSGGFYSTEDADSEGDEGKFYVWEFAEVLALLGDAAHLFTEAYDIRDTGNWEGRTILRRVRSTAALAVTYGLTPDSVERSLAESRDVLFRARMLRVRPARDEKILAAWNGLMIRALARAGRVLGEHRYLDAAARAAEFVLGTMVVGDRLHRVAMGGAVSVPAYLEDYVDLAAGLSELYEATFEKRWILEAGDLMDRAVALFADESGGFYLTAEDHADLIVRLKMSQDGSVPSGNSMAADVLLRVGRMLGREDFEERARKTFQAFASYLEKMPAGLHQMLLALHVWLGPRREIVLVGPWADPLSGLRTVVDRRFLPTALLLHSAGEETEPPILAGKTLVHGQPAAYVCHDSVCEPPILDPEALAESL